METHIKLAEAEKTKKISTHMSSFFDCSHGGITEKTHRRWMDFVYWPSQYLDFEVFLITDLLIF